MPLYLASVYLHCDACGVLPPPHTERHKMVKLYARADGGWMLPPHWRFVEETVVVCSDTCAVRLAEARELKQTKQPVAFAHSFSLECKGCPPTSWMRRGDKFWILPPGWINLEPKLPYLLCPDCTASPEKIASHRQKAAEWLNGYDPY